MVVAEIACGQTAIIFDHSLFSKTCLDIKDMKASLNMMVAEIACGQTAIMVDL